MIIMVIFIHEIFSHKILFNSSHAQTAGTILNHSMIKLIIPKSFDNSLFSKYVSPGPSYAGNELQIIYFGFNSVFAGSYSQRQPRLFFQQQTNHFLQNLFIFKLQCSSNFTKINSLSSQKLPILRPNLKLPQEVSDCYCISCEHQTWLVKDTVKEDLTFEKL